MADPIERFEQARRLGGTSLLRLRAEILLRRGDAGEIPLAPAERDELERIAAAPQPEDAGFLGNFDGYLRE